MFIKNILFLILLINQQALVNKDETENLKNEEIAQKHLKGKEFSDLSKIEIENINHAENFEDHASAKIARIKNETEDSLEILNTEEFSDQLNIQIKIGLTGELVKAELTKDSQGLEIGTFPVASHSKNKTSEFKIHKISKDKKNFFAIESNFNTGAFLTKMPDKTIQFTSGNPKKNSNMLWKIKKVNVFFKLENFNGGFATFTKHEDNFIQSPKTQDINFGDLIQLINASGKNIEEQLILKPINSNNKSNYYFREEIPNGNLVQLEKKSGEMFDVNGHNSWIITFLDNKKNLKQNVKFMLTSAKNNQLLVFENNNLITKQIASDLEKYSWKASATRKPKYEVDNVLQAGLFEGADYQDLDELKNQQLFTIEKTSELKNIVKPKGDTWINHDIQISALNIQGTSKEILENFHSGLELAIPPMLNQGIAWLESTKQNTNDFSCSFLLKTDYNSDFSICLADQNKNLKFKIIFGSSQGLFSKIIKYENENSTEVDKQEHLKNHSSKITPGNYKPFWVNIRKNVIYVGHGFEAEKNIFMCANLDEENISKIGFSCNRHGVYLAQIKIQNSIQPQTSKKEYWNFENKTPNQGFKALDSGTISIKKESDVFFVEMKNSEKQENYKIKFNAIEGLIEIEKDDKTVFEKKINLENAETLFVSKKGNIILILNQKLEEILIFKDENSIKKINLINTSPNLKIQIIPELFFELETNAIKAYYEGKILVKKPYKYSIWQEDNNIFFSDQVYNYTDIITQLQQKKASYDLILKINSDGTPSMRWAWQPENESLVSLRRNAMFLEMTAEALNLASSHTEGSGKIGQMIGSALSIGIAGSSLIPRNESIKMQAKAKYDYKKPQSGFNALGLKLNSLENIVNEEVQKNKFEINQLLTKASHWKGSTKSKINSLIPIYKQILQLIIHPNITETQGEKNTIIQGINNLFNSYQELYKHEEKISSNVDIEMFNLITSAISNKLLLSINNQTNNQNYQAMIGMANQVMQKLIKNNKLILEPNPGEIFWTNKKINSQNSSVTLVIKGSGELVLALSDFIEPASSKNFDGYLISIKNGFLRLKLNNNGSVIQEVEIPEFEIGNIIGTKITLEYKNNTLKIFLDNSDKAAMTWQDPYPLNQTKYFGIGSNQGSFNILSMQ